jgi:hypothetical protein
VTRASSSSTIRVTPLTVSVVEKAIECSNQERLMSDIRPPDGIRRQCKIWRNRHWAFP